MRLELSRDKSLLFRNGPTYGAEYGDMRADGTIGWVDPVAPEYAAKCRTSKMWTDRQFP